ncbi:MAG: hypothetical protein ACC726_16995 [Chloroflexota bacterium]
MHRFKTLVVGSCLAALTITALGAPVAAGSHQTRLAIVNGFPGKKIDVCVNGKEIRSRLPYGKKVFKTTKTAKANIKFFAKDPRKCKGKLLGKKTVSLDDATVVITRKKPQKILVFDNIGLGRIGNAAPPNAAIAIRQASDVGGVNFAVSYDNVDPNLWTHATDPEIWQKGDQTSGPDVFGPNGKVVTMWVTLPGSEFVYAGPHVRYIPSGYRAEWIFIGTNGRNARIVFFKRPATFVL